MSPRYLTVKQTCELLELSRGQRAAQDTRRRHPRGQARPRGPGRPRVPEHKLEDRLERLETDGAQ
jgi:hypothetical protein